MRAEQSLQEGDLKGALAHLQDQIRGNPADAKLRTFLFQLLAITGQWERALNQLGVASELDALAIPMAQTYREAIRCEILRGEVFAGRRSPTVFGEPEEWLALMIEAQRLSATGTQEQAGRVRAQALEMAPATSGRIDGSPFDWIMDADARLGPILEAIVNGRYYWVPFQRIRTIRLEGPEDLRDLVWLPAHFTWANGGESVGLIPTRYPGAESHPDGQIALARKTDWSEPVPGVYQGQGQRMLTTDADDYALLDIRRIDLGPAAGDDDAGGSPSEKGSSLG